MVFHLSLGDSKSPQVSRTLLGILADAVVWMVSSRLLISMPPNPCMNPLVTASSEPIAISIAVTFMFYSFFHFSSKVQVLTFLFAFFQFYSVVSRDVQSLRSTIQQVFFLSFFFVVVVDYYKIWSPGGD